jgi:hypothetical protein
LAALVEHGLFDDLIRVEQNRLRDRQAERFGGLGVDDRSWSLGRSLVLSGHELMVGAFGHVVSRADQRLELRE